MGLLFLNTAARKRDGTAGNSVFVEVKKAADNSFWELTA